MTTPESTTVPLPAVVASYLDARLTGDTTAALRTFAPDAPVTDEGRTYRGTDEVRDFLEHAGAEFTFTTELTGVRRLDDGRWVATTRLEGDFPGGVVDLDQRFTLDADLVTELAIAPR